MINLLIVNIVLFQLSLTLFVGTFLYFKHSKREKELMETNARLERTLDKQKATSDGFYD